MSQSELIFALDIGTRSVIGVVGEARGEMFHVLYMAKEEHVKRAMMDGQIEDIDQVAKIVTIVKERLEEQIGQPLTRVCVAAAGRSLRMERARALVELPEIQTVTDDFISQLEAVAIAEAEEKLSEHHKDQRFYLVGYSVAQYLLDRYPMTTIKGHNGRIMEAEVVATFLPSQVVEGLYSVVQIAGLEVASLTLEPIAALNATIPPDLRLLNLVLVDIGAGTSDIAVCRDGSVVGYTMATTAGDEITEMLMKHFLIDFKTAESLKTNLSAGEIKYMNVLGIEENTTGHQIAEAVAEATKNLVKEIAKEIRSINGCSPAAVFMAGGGSKLEGITDLLAGYLEIQNHRIAVAGSNYNRTIVAENFQLEDPEFATPLGIAVSAALGLINDSYHITLNGKGAKLFRSGSLTLLDILMMNGYTAAALIGRTGKNLAIMINGNKKIIRGKPSIPGILRLNGEPAVAGALVSAGDVIEFVPAIDGESASCTLQELLGDYAGKVHLNGEEVAWHTPLQNGDAVTTMNSSSTPTVAQRRGPRPLSAAEVQPVDAQGNPVPIPASAMRAPDMPSVPVFPGLSPDYTLGGEEVPTAPGLSPSGDMTEPVTASQIREKDMKIYGGDNITPIPVEKEEEKTQVERAVLKPIPESKSAVDFPHNPLLQAEPALEEPTQRIPNLSAEVPPASEEESNVMPTGPLPKLPSDLPAMDTATLPKVEEVKAVPPAPQPVAEVAPTPAPQTVEPVVQVDEKPTMPQIPEIQEVVPTPAPQPGGEPVAQQEQKPQMPQLPQEPELQKAADVPEVQEVQVTPPSQPAPQVQAPAPQVQPPEEPVAEAPAPKAVPERTNVEPLPAGPLPPVEEEQGTRKSLTQGRVTLNGSSLQLPPKADGSPYYLMDLLDKTDIDFRRVSKPILMVVNGREGFFVQHLYENDDIIIEEQQ